MNIPVQLNILSFNPAVHVMARQFALSMGLEESQLSSCGVVAGPDLSPAFNGSAETGLNIVVVANNQLSPENLQLLSCTGPRTRTLAHLLVQGSGINIIRAEPHPCGWPCFWANNLKIAEKKLDFRLRVKVNPALRVEFTDGRFSFIRGLAISVGETSQDLPNHFHPFSQLNDCRDRYGDELIDQALAALKRRGLPTA